MVDLAAGGFTTAIATTFRPRSLDLSLGGDSLIVSVDSQPELGIVNLVTTPHPISIVHVDSVGSSGGRFVADNVRVMGSGKAIVSLTYETPYSCCTGYLVDFDLGDGTSTLRTGSDRNTPLARSWDRSRLVAVAGSTSPVQAWLYIAANDSFAPPRLVTIPVNVYPSSADSTGSRFLLANALFDGELNPLLAFSDTAYKQGGATVLSPDGATAYLATWDGYLKVRTSDGVVLERLRLPFWAFQFAITPDGGTLIAVGGTPIYFEPPNNQVVLIDLR